MLEYTVALIKPDAVRAGVAGKIISEMEKQFIVADVLCAKWPRQFAEDFYVAHRNKGFYWKLVQFMCSDRLYMITLVAPDATRKWREMMGATNPLEASEDSIRGMYSAKDGVIMHNAVHGSDDIESAARELKFINKSFYGTFGEEAYAAIERHKNKEWNLGMGAVRTDAARKEGKKSICVDFDGVLHSYTSGWQGACEIPDLPVPGAIPWLIEMSEDPRFEICVYSSRSKEPHATAAMQIWLLEHFRRHLLLGGMGGMDAREWAERILCRLKFPTQKPAAIMTIDDRAFCFEGTFPTADWIASFRPWNKR